MAQQEVESPSVFEFYYTEPNTGIRETRYKQEKHLVQLNGKIYLGEKPQESLRVRLSDQSVQGMTEVMNESDVSAHTFYVDYNQGIITCDQSRANNSMICSYYAVGCTKISATRVVGRTNDGVQEDLQTMIDNGKDFIDMQTEYISAKDLMDDLKDIKTTCINEIDTEVNAKKKEVQDKIDEADTKINDINNMVTNCTVTCFAGKLEDSLKAIKSDGNYINKDSCFAVENGLLTFTAPEEGVYEFDGRGTSNVAGKISINAMIGTGWLVKIISNDFFIGETIRFNNTLMMLNQGQKITINTISEDFATSVTNIHFTIKYLADFDKSIADCEKTLFAGRLNDDLLTVKNGYINKNACVKDSSNSGYQYLTFTAPSRGVYEFDGRCTACSDTGEVTCQAKIGTLNGTSGYLLKVVGRDLFYGETIRFNNTLMLLNKGQKITLWDITSDISKQITNIHFKIQYVGQPT